MCNAASQCAWDEDCITIEPPATYTDGSALNSADISGYVVERTPNGASNCDARDAEVAKRFAVIVAKLIKGAW